MDKEQAHMHIYTHAREKKSQNNKSKAERKGKKVGWFLELLIGARVPGLDGVCREVRCLLACFCYIVILSYFVC
jgi:hypothetical protein